MERLDGTALRAWAAAATTALAAARARVDAVNVFPVADSDTGTNVYLTVAGGSEAVAQDPQARGSRDEAPDGGRTLAGDGPRAPDDASDAADRAGTGPLEPGADAVARRFAHGALLAARGNSGVIVSQYLAGLARSLPASAGPDDLARALTSAADAARDAVAEPQEGTVLTLAEVVARSATAAADRGGDLPDVLATALGDGHAALGRISAEHPVLRAAHVVDAGACALLVLLGALGRVVAGEGDAAPDLGWLPAAGAHGRDDESVPDGGTGTHGLGDGGGAYEVMLLVRASGEGDPPPAGAEPVTGTAPDLAPELRARMQALGDSVAVVGGEGLWHVHVHTDDPGAAVVGAALGSRAQVVVRLLVDRAVTGLPTGLGVVACTGSVDLAGPLASLGAVTLVRCDGAAVSERHLVRAVTDTGSSHVVVLPGDEATAALAHRCAETLAAAGLRLDVLPALDELRVTVGALALAGSDPGAGADARLAACLRSLQGLRTSEVRDPAPGSALAAVDALLAGHAGAAGAETLTLLTGCDVTPSARAELEEHLAERHPELTVLGAGPADGVPSYWMGVE
ncbi:DAK2 domain-containing protein [Cellulomonas sp. NS3]|uniref:DAK2 domain-containing protein n=1 Tax=Cellulomonas sp. NS3 TaxID=2973977 RepID=UPI002163CAC8|nr:DAK2 domain-containing protein [Cellulomonas sp. NS3]